MSTQPDVTTSNPTLDTILRIVPQLTFAQLSRLAEARHPIDDDLYDRALERAEALGSGVSDEAGDLLQAAWVGSEDRFGAWQDERRSAPLDIADGAFRTSLARVGALFLLIGTPLALVAALISAASWYAPLVVLAASVAVIAAALWPAIMAVEGQIDDRGLVLDEAWDAINGAIQATLVAHLVNAPGGLDRSDYDLLTGSWSSAILPLTAPPAEDAIPRVHAA